MDNKQQRIFNKILDNNSLPHHNTFVQHRNLKEFRGFFIERVNPNHVIFLYGKLKKPVDKNYSKVIKVGEILLPMFIGLFFNSLLFNIAINIIVGSILLSFALDYLLECDNPYVDRYRGTAKLRKNYFCG